MDTPYFVPISHIIRPFENPAADPQGSTKAVVGIPIAALPPNCTLVSLKPFFDEFRTSPERRIGHTTLGPNSFVNYVKRFRNMEQTVCFVKPNLFGRHRVTCVFNYHPAGPADSLTGFGDFTVTTYAAKEKLEMIVLELSKLEIPMYVGGKNG